MCETLNFILYSWSSYFAFFELRKLYHFKIVCSQKLIRSLADIAEHICQIKRRSDVNFILKRAKEYFFISGHSN